MINRLCFLACAVIHLSLQAQYKQIDIFPGDSSFQLINKLVQNYKPITVLDYNQARVKMYTEIYNQHDSVSCVYSKHTLYLNPSSSDPIGYLIKNGDPNGINCEHTFPQSKGAEFGNAKSDMHHLFPVRAEVNEARSNFPFGEINDDQTQVWYYKSQAQTKKPSQMIDEYSESIDGMFEPREDSKGNIARAVFYFFTMYELQADRSFFDRMKPTLCEWHLKDPADSLEWERTHQIANYQDQRPNPFVLDCSLARRTYCNNYSGCQKSVATYDESRFRFVIDPNPFYDELHITRNDINSDCQIEIFNLFGQRLIQYTWMKNQKEDYINTQSLIPGCYFVIFKNKTQIYKKRLLVKN